jgi:signal transduction histidine kinase
MEVKNTEFSVSKSIAVLINRVLVIVFILPFIYLGVHWWVVPGIFPIALVVPFLVLPVFVYTLNRFEKYEWSKFLGLLGYNVAVFLVASSESTATGIYLHFVSCCAVTMALYKYSDLWKSIAFISLSVSFLIIVHLFQLDILPFRDYGPQWTKIFFVVHTVSTAIIACYSFFTVVGVNYRSQKNLYAKQNIIEQQNEELRKTNRELDKFVYSASHDLRAPLTSILGLVNLMEMDKQTPQEEYLSKIKSQISKMETFMRDVVDYSRNARQEVKIEEINLHDKVKDVLQSLSYFNNAHLMTFEVDIPANQTILSDSYRLGVILSNLISNAIKYADVRKAKPFVHVSFFMEHGCPHVRIKDNGIGIAQDHLPKIFDMFYRASSSSNGSGLGLYIAMESAQKLNYKIHAQSVISEGTVLTIELPEYAAHPESI